MTKLIILSNSVKKYMTYEEVLKQFEAMMNQFANDTINRMVYNKPEKEELMQELRLQAWFAYERYDGRGAFSTYLHYYLQNAITRSTNKLYAKKRQNENGTVSLNTIIGGESDDVEMEDLLGEKDAELESVEFCNFIEKIEQTLNTNEKTLLKSMMNKKDLSVRDLADSWGISRQAANKRFNKFREKMMGIMVESGYIA